MTPSATRYRSTLNCHCESPCWMLVLEKKLTAPNRNILWQRQITLRRGLTVRIEMSSVTVWTCRMTAHIVWDWEADCSRQRSCLRISSAQAVLVISPSPDFKTRKSTQPKVVESGASKSTFRLVWPRTVTFWMSDRGQLVSFWITIGWFVFQNIVLASWNRMNGRTNTRDIIGHFRDDLRLKWPNQHWNSTEGRWLVNHVKGQSHQAQLTKR